MGSVEFVVLALLFIVVVFGFVVFFGAPYLPTKKRQIEAALDLLDLKPGETLLELGSGDGRVATAAAKRGYKVVGYELNPVLVLISRLATWRYRKNVKIILGNFWSLKWPEAQAIFVFLIGHKMKNLNNKITQECQKPVKLVSFAFEIPDKKPADEKNGIFLYEYRQI